MKGETVQSLSGKQKQNSNPGGLGVTTAKYSYFLKRSMESLPGDGPSRDKAARVAQPHTWSFSPSKKGYLPICKSWSSWKLAPHMATPASPPQVRGAQWTLSAPAFTTAWKWISWREILSRELTRPSSLLAFKAFQAVGLSSLVRAEMQGLGNVNNTDASHERYFQV